MQFFDLNIPYLESDKNKKSNREIRLVTMAKAVELGYSGIAYNRTIKGAMSQSDACTISRFPLHSLLKHHTSLSSFHRRLLGVPLNDAFRQYTRLTVIIDSDAQSSALNSGNPVLKTYDLVAVRPLNQLLFDHACQSAQVDMISIDFGKRLPFRLKISSIKSAIERGVYFEIMYSCFLEDAQVRRQMISSAKLLVEWTRGKNLIVSSAASSSSHELRGPNDVSNLLHLLGLSSEKAKTAISKNCSLLIASALRKKQFYKDAIRVEMLPSGGPTNRKEPWIIDDLNWDPISSGEGDLLLEELASAFSDSERVSETVKSIEFTSLVHSVDLVDDDALAERADKMAGTDSCVVESNADGLVSGDVQELLYKSEQSDVHADEIMNVDSSIERISSNGLVLGSSPRMEEVAKVCEPNEKDHFVVKAYTEECLSSKTMMQVDSFYVGKTDYNNINARSMLAEHMLETKKQAQELVESDRLSIGERNSGDAPCVEDMIKDHEQNEEHHYEVKTDTNESLLSGTIMQVDSSYQGKNDNNLIAKSILAVDLMTETRNQAQELVNPEDRSFVKRKSGNHKLKKSASGPVLRFPFKRLLLQQFKRKGRTSMYKTKKGTRSCQDRGHVAMTAVNNILKIWWQ